MECTTKSIGNESTDPQRGSEDSPVNLEGVTVGCHINRRFHGQKTKIPPGLIATHCSGRIRALSTMIKRPKNRTGESGLEAIIMF